jgi:hypothetical protein
MRISCSSDMRVKLTGIRVSSRFDPIGECSRCAIGRPSGSPLFEFDFMTH